MSNNNLPVVDEARISAIFASLEGMDVALDPDPLQYGPKRLNHNVAKVRSMLSRCERIYLQVSHDLQNYKSSHRTSELDFDLQMQDLLANDPEVKAGRNVRDRDALGTMKLRAGREQVMSLEVAIQDLEMVLTVIKAKRADLRDIQGRLRDQMKLCQEEVGLGSRWGSIPHPGVRAPDIDRAPKTDTVALEAMQELLQSTGEMAEVDLKPGDETWMAEAASEDEAAILAELEQGVQYSEDDDAVLDEISVDSVVETEVVETEVVEVDLDIEDDEIPESPSEVVPAVESDDEVDAIFSQLEIAPAKKAPAIGEDVDLDDLLGMFGG